MTLFWFITILIITAIIAIGAHMYLEHERANGLMEYGISKNQHLAYLLTRDKYSLNYIVKLSHDFNIRYDSKNPTNEYDRTKIEENVNNIIEDVNGNFDSFFLWRVLNGKSDEFELLKRHITRTKFMDRIEACLPQGSNKPSYSLKGEKLTIAFGCLVEISIPIDVEDKRNLDQGE